MDKKILGNLLTVSLTKYNFENYGSKLFYLELKDSIIILEQTVYNGGAEIYLSIIIKECHPEISKITKNIIKDNSENNQKEVKRKEKIEKLNTTYLQNKKDKEKIKKVQKEKICPECGKTFTGKNVYCSPECYDKFRSKSKRPDIVSLCKKYKELNGNLTHLGKFYGVSDNAVKKWLVLYGIYKNIPDL